MLAISLIKIVLKGHSLDTTNITHAIRLLLRQNGVLYIENDELIFETKKSIFNLSKPDKSRDSQTIDEVINTIVRR